MSFFYKKSLYTIPGNYQWIKPSTTPGAGPFGTTYLESIITVIGASSGGSSGNAANNQGGTTVSGGEGGFGGGFGQATYLPAALNSIENILVAAKSVGGAANSQSGAATGIQVGLHSLGTATSNFGSHITCLGGGPSHSGTGGTVSVIGGSNVLSFQGGVTLALATPKNSEVNIYPGLLGSGGIFCWPPTNNHGGANGGQAYSVSAPVFAGNGGGATNGGGVGATNGGQGGDPLVPSAGGGGSSTVTPGLIPGRGGNGANAAPNSGCGGGGGGASANGNSAGSGFIVSGKGGDGADALVSVVDVFTIPPLLPPYVFDLEIIAWYHMFNMARPISLTGRYKS